MSSQPPPPEQPGGDARPGGWQPAPPPENPSGGWQPAPPPAQPGAGDPGGGWQPAPPPPPSQPGGSGGSWQPSPAPSPGYQPPPPPPGAGGQPGAYAPAAAGAQYGTPAWATSGLATATRYAGFWIRVVAYIIDAVIIGVFNFIWIFVVTLAAGGSINGAPASLLQLVASLVGIAYFAFMWSSRGQTIGQMALSLRVTRSDGSPLTLGRAIGRAFALWLAFVIIFIGVIMVAFTQRKQGLHDLLADTVVVHN